MMLTWPSALPAAQTASTPPIAAADVASLAATGLAAAEAGALAGADTPVDGAAALGDRGAAGLLHAATRTVARASPPTIRVVMVRTFLLQIRLRSLRTRPPGRPTVPRTSSGD